MKILYITNALSEGGVETLLYSLSKELNGRCHDVSILVLKKDEIYLKDSFEKAGIKIIVGRYKNLYNFLNIILIRKYLCMYDIIHIHLFPAQLYACIANKLLWNKKRKLITTEHNTWNYRRKYNIFRYLDCWMYKQYDCIAGISDDTSASLKKWIGCQDVDRRIITVNNGVELKEPILQEKAIELADLKCTESDFILVMVARFNAQKDQETLIRALSHLASNVHVVFVGSGETLEYNKNLAKSLNLDARVFFCGFRNDIPAILHIAHVGILCSHWEGFGLSVVEYMLAGLPVLATDVPGVGKIVGWDELLYPPKNEKVLAMKIARMMNDKSYYEQVRQYCIRRAKDFSVEKMADTYLTIYDKMIT